MLAVVCFYDACTLFRAANNDTNPRKEYKFIANISHSFNPLLNKKKKQSASSQKNITPSARPQTASPNIKVKTLESKDARKGNLFKIDTPYRRIIVTNKEILSVDTVRIKEAKLFNSVLAWLGIKYQYGGHSKKSIDCSALTRALLHASYRVSLPRTALEQYRFVTPVKQKDLQEGDLVFFAIQKKNRVSHVGVYLSNDYFIHAGTSSGVTLSALRTPYWQKRILRYGRYKKQ